MPARLSWHLDTPFRPVIPDPLGAFGIKGLIQKPAEMHCSSETLELAGILLTVDTARSWSRPAGETKADIWALIENFENRTRRHSLFDVWFPTGVPAAVLGELTLISHPLLGERQTSSPANSSILSELCSGGQVIGLHLHLFGSTPPSGLRTSKKGSNGDVFFRASRLSCRYGCLQQCGHVGLPTG